MGTKFGKLASLEETLKDRAEFHKEGLKRIIEYYSLPEHEREEKTGLRDPPHEIFVKRASGMISLGLNLKEVLYPQDEAIGFILIGVGTEILLKAIILKKDSNYFLKNINVEKEKTPSYRQCADKLNEQFSKTLTPKQAQRIKEVLTLIKQQRDNAVHLGFHRIEAHGDDYQMAHVLEFLFSYFFKNTANDIVQELRKFKNKAKKVMTGRDYEPVELPMS